MFLDHDTKVCIIGNWAGDKYIGALITHLGPMPQGGWSLPDLLEIFVGYDVMINHLPEGDARGKIRLYVDAPGKKFSQR